MQIVQNRQQAINVLAYSAAKETDNSDLETNAHAKVALMLMQLNAYRTLGFWRVIGRNPNATNAYRLFLQDATNSTLPTQLDRDLADLVLTGYLNSCTPLSEFQNTQNYPDVTQNISGLESLASAFQPFDGDSSNNNSALMNQFTIDASWADGVQGYFSGAYVIEGEDRALVITRPDRTYPPLYFPVCHN